ncbi:TetR/AcrR family transcriptional regulator [Streptomyces sp. NPDC048512]|uniref:TetR/AcrR family transcriptional regulator n=1 Tax=Streptomyces sp. NPDC048512 TaxID=3365563 RepID=UPI00371F9596
MASDSTGTGGRRASDRGRYGRLSRDRVLASALDVVDRDGLSGLSMRKLGAELGVEAMALYRYASGKDALLDGLVEAFCLELETELATEGEDGRAPVDRESRLHAPTGEHTSPLRREADDWVQALHRMARAAYRVALRHPNVVPLLATRLLSTPLARRAPAVLRTDERVLVLLREAGLDDRRSVVVHRAFTAWLLGYLLVELRAMDDDPAEPEPAFRLGLHRLSAEEFPRLRAMAPALAEQGGHAELDAGLDALLDHLG